MVSGAGSGLGLMVVSVAIWILVVLEYFWVVLERFLGGFGVFLELWFEFDCEGFRFSGWCCIWLLGFLGVLVSCGVGIIYVSWVAVGFGV